MSADSTEAELLQQTLNRLSEEGYDVFAHPSEQARPAFMKQFQPDAIALSPKGNLVIEIVTPSANPETKVKELADLVRGHDNWSLRIVRVEPHRPEAPPLEKQSRAAVLKSLQLSDELLAHDAAHPALLNTWATFEAVARRLPSFDFHKPQSPGRIVQQLASEGIVTPDDADLLRKLALARNRFIHGELGMPADPTDVARFAQIVREIESRNAND